MYNLNSMFKFIPGQSKVASFGKHRNVLWDSLTLIVLMWRIG